MLILRITTKSPAWVASLVISLLLVQTPSLAFFKKPSWLQKPQSEETFWSQMSRDFTIDGAEDNPSVQRHIRWYQDHPKHLQRVLKGAEPFIHYVYEQTHRKNLPAELALIPIIESQYNPQSGSHKGPAGLWQMMPGTATRYGLQVDRQYDGRRDVMASTRAALTYLTYLHRYFKNDWILAVAAYNAGEVKIESLARQHENFWSMPVSRVTREYVPKLLAIASIIRHPGYYNVHLPEVATLHNLEEQTWQAAKVEEPTPITDNTTLVNLEIPKAEKTEVVADLPAPVLSKKITYKIKKNDTLNKIALKYKVKAQDIKKINHLKSNNLTIGKEITIPKTKDDRKSPVVKKKKKQHKKGHA